MSDNKGLTHKGELAPTKFKLELWLVDLQEAKNAQMEANRLMFNLTRNVRGVNYNGSKGSECFSV